MTPEQRLADVFVALAGGTTDGPLDIPGTLSVLARRSPALLGAGAAAVVFAPEEREAAHVAGSDSEVWRLEHDAVGWQEGPGHECHLIHRLPVRAALDCGPARQRWPHYALRALRLGYTHVVALPLREQTRISGALVLLSGTRQNSFSQDSLALGQSIADFTTVTLHRAVEADRSRALAAQLETALASRVIIEQAKGILATRWAVPLDEAFARLRRHARSRQRPLSDVAREVVEGRADHELTGE